VRVTAPRGDQYVCSQSPGKQVCIALPRSTFEKSREHVTVAVPSRAAREPARRRAARLTLEARLAQHLAGEHAGRQAFYR